MNPHSARQSSQGADTEERSVCALGVNIPSLYLLPRRREYTRVYTTVYPRVYNCVHTCTLPRSKYVPCSVHFELSSELTPRLSKLLAKAPSDMK